MREAAPGTIVIATRNQGKVKEFAALFGAKGLRVLSLADYPELPEIVEDGATFADNALIKAKEVALRLGVPVIADDSGLTVDALGGEPGVYSARYAGEHATDGDNNAKLQRELSQAAQAAPLLGPEHPSLYGPAAFVCAMALYDPTAGDNGRAVTAEGRCEGYIAAEPRGAGGFGYDPYFYLPAFGRTMAELTMEEKNRISHRGEAMRKLVQAMG